MTTFNKIAYFECLRGIQLDKGALRVLVDLFTYSDADGGNIYPGIERLAEDCCMGESTVSAHLKLLTERGFIRQEYRGGRKGKPRNYASRYRLCMPPTTSEKSEVVSESTTSEKSEVVGRPPLKSQKTTSEKSEPTKPYTKPSSNQVMGGTREAPAVSAEIVRIADSIPAKQSDDPPRVLVDFLFDPNPPPGHCPRHPGGIGGNGTPCKACGLAMEMLTDWYRANKPSAIDLKIERLHRIKDRLNNGSGLDNAESEHDAIAVEVAVIAEEPDNKPGHQTSIFVGINGEGGHDSRFAGQGAERKNVPRRRGKLRRSPTPAVGRARRGPSWPVQQHIDHEGCKCMITMSRPGAPTMYARYRVPFTVGS